MSLPPLRPLQVGEIVDVSLGLYRRHFGPLVLVSLVCSGIPAVISVYVEAAGGVLLNPVLYALNLLLSIVLNALAIAATVHIISESYLGRLIGPGEALRRAQGLIVRLIVLSLLFSLLVGVGFVLLVIPGVIALTGLILGTQALVIENLPSATSALGRSWSLTRGNRLRVLGVLLVAMILYAVPIIGASIVLGLIGGAAGIATGGATTATLGAVTVAVIGAVGVLLFPLFYAMLTVAYYDLRVRKEGFDLEMLAGSLHAEPV